MLCSAFQIDELHRHNQSLVGKFHKGVPTMVCRHENCCKLSTITSAWQVFHTCNLIWEPKF